MSFIKEQISVIKEKDPSIHSTLEAVLTPGFKALFYLHRYILSFDI